MFQTLLRRDAGLTKIEIGDMDLYQSTLILAEVTGFFFPHGFEFFSYRRLLQISMGQENFTKPPTSQPFQGSIFNNDYECAFSALKQYIRDLEAQQDQSVLLKNIFLNSQALFYKLAGYTYNI